MKKEIPPTNGLNIEFKDLFIFDPRVDLSIYLAHLLNIPKPSLTCSGTVALIIALQTLQKSQPQRTQVIIPAWTCPLVALAIEKIGLTAVLCDLEPHKLNFDLLQLQQLTNTNTLAIVVTHYAGIAYDFSLVQEIAQHYQAFIIEDAAQSMGTKIYQQSVGLIGDVAFFSLAFGKGLTSAEGGVLFSRHLKINQQLSERSAQLPVLNKWETKRCLELIGYSLLYRPATLTWMYGRPLRTALNNDDEITAVGDNFDLSSIPIHQLGKWRSQVAAHASTRLQQHWNHARIRAKKRISQLKLLPHLHVFDESENTQATFPFLICYVENEILCQKILDELWCSGLGITKLFVRSISHYPALSHIQACTPNATKFATHSFTISNSAWLDNHHFQIIFKVLERILTSPT